MPLLKQGTTYKVKQKLIEQFPPKIEFENKLDTNINLEIKENVDALNHTFKIVIAPTSTPQKTA